VERIVLSEDAIRKLELEHGIELHGENYEREGEAAERESRSRRRYHREAEDDKLPILKTAAYQYRLNLSNENIQETAFERDSIGAERKRIIEDYEREGHELKEQEHRTAADLLRRLEISNLTIETLIGAQHGQDNMNDAMRKRLAEADFTQPQIDAIMEKEHKRKQQQQLASRPLKTAPPPPADAPTSISRAPVYPKVHTDHMATETLKYYDIPWEYDQVRKKDRITVVETPTDFDRSPTLPTSSSSANWTNVRLMSSSISPSVSGQIQSCWKIPGAVS
jgi:hypothetical protein